MAYNYDRAKAAASLIEFEDMPEKKKAILKHVPSRWKPLDVFDGVHGYIVVFEGQPRLTKEVMSKLISFSEFRWVETENRGRSGLIHVGI